MSADWEERTESPGSVSARDWRVTSLSGLDRYGDNVEQSRGFQFLSTSSVEAEENIPNSSEEDQGGSVVVVAGCQDQARTDQLASRQCRVR